MQFVHEHLPPIRLKILPNAQNPTKNSQSVFIILPEWRYFAKSGHNGADRAVKYCLTSCQMRFS